MAFKQVSYKLPEAYIKFVKDQALALDESEGYIIQLSIQALGKDELPLPRRRDREEK